MATGKALNGKPYAGNPHVRFDEGAGAPRHSGRSALLYHNYKKILFGLALAMAGAGLAFDAEYTADQNVTISQGGAYLVTGTGGGSVTVSENVTGVELTIRDVTWTGNATKINLNAGSSVSLVIEGVSSITHTGSASGPGINVPETSALAVSGPGTLNIVTYVTSCIGCAKNATMGTLTINGGTIVAHAGGPNSAKGGLSAAIGGSYGNPDRGGNGGTVVVNGGKLVAVGYSDAPGIGGGNGYGAGGGGDAGTLTVNGGHVIAMTRHLGQSGWYGDYAAPAVGPGASRQNVAKHGAPGRITVTGGILEAWVDRAEASCFGIARNVGQAATVPADAGLFVTGGTVKWNHLIMDETDFTYSFANCNVGCSSGPERKLTGLWLPVDTDIATLFPAGVNFEKTPGVTVAANAIRLADLVSENVTLDSSSPFTVVGSSAATANKVVASGDIEAALCGVNSTGSWEVPANSTSILWICAGNEISVVASGTCYKLPETGTLDLRGTGYLYCENKLGSNNANSLQSAIGNSTSNGKWGTLKLDGPTVEAIGSERAAGVGGGYTNDSKKGASGGGKVIVESGTLIAKGKGGAAGIGGGSAYQGAGGSGPEVIVKTNGTIYAYNVGAGNGVNKDTTAGGVAIGAGCKLWDGSVVANVGSITVDGGKLYASVNKAGASCFGAGSGNSTFPANPNMTGSLTVKNGGQVFFGHAKFEGQYTVTIDDGTLGTMSDTPAASWVAFNSPATVTNALTIAGPVAPELAKLPSFKNNPALNIETGVTLMDGMLPGEWVEVNDMDKVTLSPAVMRRTKNDGDRVLTRFETRDGWINLADLTGVYDITENGVYKFYGTGTSPVSIRVADNVVCTNVLGEASITVNGGSVAPLELGAGSRVSLQLMGANTMNRIGGSGGYAVIRVPEGAALTISDGAEEGEATGSLTIDETNLNKDNVVGIGEAGVDSQMGTLTIDSGNVTITMKHDGRGIGGAAIGSAGQGSSCGTVTINGGTVTLDGPGLGPAIGAGTDNTRMGHGGNVTINGGRVIAKGYGGASAIGLAPTYGNCTPGTPGTFTMNDGTLYAYAYKGGSFGGTQCGAAIGGSGTRNGTTGSTIGQVTFNGGSAYLYSEGACSIGCGQSSNGSEPAARAATDRVTINGGCIWAPQGIQGDAVNTAGQKLKLVSIPNSFFPSYPYTLDLGGSTTYTFPNSTFSDHLEHIYLPSGVYEPEANLAIVVGDADDMTPRSYTMSSGAAKVFVVGKATLSSSTALSGAGVIVLGDGSETTFDGLDFTSASGNGYHSSVVVQDGATAKVILKGENSLKRPVANESVIHLPVGAKLTIDGGEDDWLRISQTTVDGSVGIGVGYYDTTHSMGTFILDGGNVEIKFNPGSGNTGNTGVALGVAVGNRNAGTVIVNGGTLLAASGALSPGIGGGYTYNGRSADGGTVIVNGGVVTAKGYGGAAGIGGGTAYGNNGTCGKGGSFTLNGGTVYAYAYAGGRYGAGGRCGAAIGGPAQREKDEVGGMGTVTINDGTLYAYAEVGAAVGHGNTVTGTYKIENGSDGAFTIMGGSVKLVSGNGATTLYHVTPKNGTLEPPLVRVPARKFGAPPYALEFVEKDAAEGTTPFTYPYHGAGYADDDSLYFYLPHGKYRMNGRFCVVGESGVRFPGVTIIVR